MKKSAQRRRPQAQIKEEKRLELEQKMQVEQKLAQFDQMQQQMAEMQQQMQAAQAQITDAKVIHGQVQQFFNDGIIVQDEDNTFRVVEDPNERQVRKAAFESKRHDQSQIQVQQKQQEEDMQED